MLTLLSLLACVGADTLAPSLALGEVPGVAHLPPDATVLVGAELEGLERSPVFLAWLEGLGLSQADLDAQLRAAGGGLGSVERLVGACDAQGCAALAEGELGGVDLERAARQARRGLAHPRRLRLDEARPDRVLARHRGVWLRAEPLGASRLLFGHEEAARGLASAGRGPQGVGPLDIPAGDVWALVREPELLRSQLERFLPRSGHHQAARLLRRLRSQALPPFAAAVRSAAWALDLETGRLVLRARLDSPWVAIQVEELLDAALQVERLRTHEAPGLDEVLDGAVVRRAGEVVELELGGVHAALPALLEEAR